MATLFISDLHLHERRPAVTRMLVEFLAGRAATAEALYVLGDLFDAWVGDDDDSPLASEVAQAFSALSQQGVALYFIHGNRDFLLGQDYADACGMTLLPEQIVIDLYGQPTLIMHGDTLCVDDVEYQALRARLRSPAWQQAVLAKPLAERRALAVTLRSESREALQLKAEDITDVNQQAVERAMRDAGVLRLIHGHTHRPDVHELNWGGQPAQRIVLDDWGDRGFTLVCDANGCHRRAINAA